MNHPRHRLDEVIHAPVRFAVMATLAAADRAEFAFVRDTVEITDSALSKQVSTLEKAGYVKVTKGYVGKRPRTWLSLTSRRTLRLRLPLRRLARDRRQRLEPTGIAADPFREACRHLIGTTLDAGKGCGAGVVRTDW